jgi:hypothetical protein
MSLSDVTGKIKNDPSQQYSTLEKQVLKDRGIVPKGFWFARDNVMIKKEDISSTLNSPEGKLISKVITTENKTLSLKEIFYNIHKSLYENTSISIVLMGLERKKENVKKVKKKKESTSIINPSIFALMLPYILAFFSWVYDKITKFIDKVKKIFKEVSDFIINAYSAVVSSITGAASTFLQAVGLEKPPTVTSTPTPQQQSVSVESAPPPENQGDVLVSNESAGVQPAEQPAAAQTGESQTKTSPADPDKKTAAPESSPVTPVAKTPETKPQVSKQVAPVTVLTSKDKEGIVTKPGTSVDGVDPQVLSMISVLQKKTGKTLRITDGKRALGEKAGKMIKGGSGTNPHVLGKAVDISVRNSKLSDADQEKISEEALNLGFTGIGAEGDHLHLDIAHKTPMTWGNSPKYNYEGAPQWAKTLLSVHGGRPLGTKVVEKSATPATIIINKNTRVASNDTPANNSFPAGPSLDKHFDIHNVPTGQSHHAV